MSGSTPSQERKRPTLFRPELLFPYDTRFVPLPVPVPDICDQPMVQICLNTVWASHLDGLLNRLIYRDAWLGTDDQVDHAIDQVVQIMAMLGEIPMGCGCGNNFPTRFNANGHLEISYDGGTTWQPYPQGDPRQNAPLSPPLPGPDDADKKCLAAQSATEFIKGQFVDQLNDGQTFTQIFELILSVIALLLTGPGAALIVPVILTIVGGVVNTIPSVIQGAFDATQVGILQCILYCRVSADGSFTEAAWQGVKSDIIDQMDVAVAEFLKGIVNAIGLVGLTNAARAGLTTGITDCSGCDCGFTCVEKYQIWDRTAESIPITYYGTILEREDNRIRVQFNTNYITLTTNDENDCCQVVDWQLVSGGAVFSTAHNLCGEPFDGAFEHETTVLNQCVWIFEFQALGADRPVVDIFFSTCP